jgi:hypothetical protein
LYIVDKRTALTSLTITGKNRETPQVDVRVFRLVENAADRFIIGEGNYATGCFELPTDCIEGLSVYARRRVEALPIFLKGRA